MHVSFEQRKTRLSGYVIEDQKLRRTLQSKALDIKLNSSCKVFLSNKYTDPSYKLCPANAGKKQ